MEKMYCKNAVSGKLHGENSVTLANVKTVKICSYNMTENIQNMTEPNTKI